MSPEELIKLIHVCRDESDLRLPEYQPLAEEMERDPSIREWWDTARRTDHSIREALRDVPVPVGLKERILRGLVAPALPVNVAAAGVVPDAGVSEETPQSIPAGLEPAGLAARRHRWNWRRRTWSAALVGLAALLLVWIVSWRPEEPMLTDELGHAAQWIGMLDESKWLTEKAPLVNFPLPQELQAWSIRWQELQGTPRRQRVVCYELRTPGPRAFLFVARARPRPALPQAPPPKPYPSSRWSMGVWRGESIVFVLAVEAGQEAYHQLIRRRQPRIV